MSNIFSTDGLFYKISTVIYNIMALNFFWILFSLPLVTIGASTTALFYVSGKIVRKENIKSIFHAFWKSFKSNFKKATLIWLILIVIFFVYYLSIINIVTFAGIVRLMYPIQILALIELLIVGIYIFPLLARYHITIRSGLKAAFFIGNRHLLTTILCLSIFPGLYLLLKISSIFIFGVMSVYGMWISYHLKDIFERYVDNGTNIS